MSPAGHELVARLLAERLTGPQMAWWVVPEAGGEIVPAALERPVGSRCPEGLDGSFGVQDTPRPSRPDVAEFWRIRPRVVF